VLHDLADHPDKRDKHRIFLLTANMGMLSSEMVELLGCQEVPVLPKPFDTVSRKTEENTNDLQLFLSHEKPAVRL
jgi:hypothetical protein